MRDELKKAFGKATECLEDAREFLKQMMEFSENKSG